MKPLNAILSARRRRCAWSGNLEGLVLGRTATEPFHDGELRKRALKLWAAAKLDPIGLHESRHTAASWFIGANVNLKAISVLMGHSSISITIDRYGHLLPGSEAEAADLLDAYLDRQLMAA